MELRKLSDVELENNLISLVQKERSLLCQIILHVIELERRKKYLNLHPNLFSYLRDKLKYSHGSAQRRIDAAVLALEVPTVLKDVQSGELNLTQITTAQVAFRLAAKTHKTRIPAEVKQKVLEQIKSKSVAESEVILCAGLNIKPKSKLKIKHQADESVHIEMTLSKEQWAKFQRTRELLSHSVPTGNFTDLIEYFTDRVIAQKDKTIPKNQKVVAKPERSPVTTAGTQIPIGKSEAPTPKHSGRFFPPVRRKTIKISIQRAVFARDQCCQYMDKNSGHVCGSMWGLQLDHIRPVWSGGSDDEANLRVLCGRHNRELYRRQKLANLAL